MKKIFILLICLFLNINNVSAVAVIDVGTLTEYDKVFKRREMICWDQNQQFFQKSYIERKLEGDSDEDAFLYAHIYSFRICKREGKDRANTYAQKYVLKIKEGFDSQQAAAYAEAYTVRIFADPKNPDGAHDFASYYVSTVAPGDNITV